jgi:acetyltransferase
MAEYPAGLERSHTLADGRSVTIRPVRDEDQAAEQVFFDRLGTEARRLRFMKFVRAVNERLVHAFTHIDYESRMAFVCEADAGGAKRIVGEARYAAIPQSKSCDFGIVIADDWHKTGIAGLLMLALIDYARAQGFETMESIVLRDNHDMLRFVRALGFEVRPVPEEATLLQVVKPLGRYAGGASASRNRA